ncbi:YbaN family protein [Anaeromyxobacter sp. Fw109-5]|uniref:YbaN family protein n=1 Tax=Anaeromyxobacter sp. (strain Fw109-5) TaxID=404589 RepID=UPI0000ED7637|nr:YbaN family protein [Anaeromyxobacter sp. Fw109-5]ABS25905.1 protein of unknown function DUF454 [Anaeromyxobacter sp. Fw109-5]
MPDLPPRPVATPSQRAHRRWLLLALGWSCFALGAVGAVLPLIPTTPLMLVALWAFSSSSERFHDWLYGHRVFGPPLQRWQRERVLPLWVKLVAVTSMAASFAYAALGARVPWYALVTMGAVMLFGVAYISRIPSRPRTDLPGERGLHAPPDRVAVSGREQGQGQGAPAEPAPERAGRPRSA